MVKDYFLGGFTYFLGGFWHSRQFRIVVVLVSALGCIQGRSFVGAKLGAGPPLPYQFSIG